MIEEPKQDGYYWCQQQDPRGQTNYFMVQRSVEEWFSCDGRYPRFDWNELAPRIVAIEPVTPPSWERKS